MTTISEVEDRVLQQVRNLIEEGLVDFRSFQCPRCGNVGGLEALTGSTAEVTFSGCRHRLYGDLAEAYLAKAFPGPAAQRVIAEGAPHGDQP